MKFSRRKKRVILGFLALLFVVFFVIIGSFRFAESIREKQRYEEERAALVPPPPNFVVVENKSMPRIRRYAAQLRPWAQAGVAAEASGRVVETLVEAGDFVEEGTPLVRLDDRLASIAVDQARAQYEESVRLLEEASRLLETRAISRSAFETQSAAVSLDHANLEEARERLSRHEVRAPFSGFVDERLVDKGDAVNLNQPVVRLVDLEKLRVEFFVGERELESFEKGTRLELRLTARPGEVFYPAVDFQARSADPSTRLFRIEAVFENTEKPLPGGLQGVVEAAIEQYQNFPFVPAAAVRFEGRRSRVWKMDTDTGEGSVVEIRVGPEIDGFYPVLEGLRSGDTLLIH